MFRAGKLSLGLVVPIENYASRPIPNLHHHLERAQLAEVLGFSAIWLRDVPFNVPSFGDAGQTFDPFVYLGLLAAKTQQISLGVASVILPLRHPAHVAKAAATVDTLSEGRLVLGVASGDRPEEYPALNIPFNDRSARFQESFEYIRRMNDEFPEFENVFGKFNGNIDMIPKPPTGKLPLLITGGSRQDPEWLANHGDGWMLYPRPAPLQAKIIRNWRDQIKTTGRGNQPVMEPLYVDLAEDPDTPPQPIHLGLRLGMKALRDYLETRRQIGVNHVALNLRFNQSDIETAMKRLADDLLPDFSQ
ncbi:MAG: LLM class oxidoreductase [Verrucomicrobiota bacterium]